MGDRISYSSRVPHIILYVVTRRHQSIIILDHTIVSFLRKLIPCPLGVIVTVSIKGCNLKQCITISGLVQLSKNFFIFFWLRAETWPVISSTYLSTSMEVSTDKHLLFRVTAQSVIPGLRWHLQQQINSSKRIQTGYMNLFRIIFIFVGRSWFWSCFQNWECCRTSPKQIPGWIKGTEGECVNSRIYLCRGRF